MRRAVVIGLGAAGVRHAVVLKECDPSIEVMGVSRGGVGNRSGIDHVVGSPGEALEFDPDYVIHSGPAPFRIDQITPFAKRGATLLLEKPVSSSMEQLDDFEAIIAASGSSVTVGYNLRFLPILQSARRLVAGDAIGQINHVRVEVGQYLPDWRQGDYRRTVSASKALGGGALRELSHELDYLCWLLGTPRSVSARLARYSDLELDVEDTADLLVEFHSGVQASAHLDMTQRPPCRRARFVGSAGSLEIDLLKSTLHLHTAEQTIGETFTPYGEEVARTYRAQTASFLRAGHGSTYAATLDDGLAVLAVIDAAELSDLSGERVSVRPRTHGDGEAS